MRILLIAGHGAGDPGAVSTIQGKQYREADETRALVSYLLAALKAYDVSVSVYDTGRNAFADYKSGALASVAQFSRYDYVLELHFNAFNAAASGVECYVTASENGAGVEEAICQNIAALGLANRGVKRKNFSVIAKAKAAGASAALLEACFIDSGKDMALYTKSRRTFAEAIARGIAKGFGLKKRESELGKAKRTIQEKAGLSDGTIAYLAAYQYGDDLLRKLAAAMQ